MPQKNTPNTFLGISILYKTQGDEVSSPDVQMHIIAKEGLSMFAGWLGRGKNSRTKRM